MADGKHVNILEAKIAFPKTVYIVGTGPEDDRVHAAIPKGAFVIALNGAIDYDLPATPAIWLMGDPAVMRRKYFRHNMEFIRTSGFDLSPASIKAGGPTIPVVEYERFHSHFPWIKTVYMKQVGGMEDLGPFKKEDGCLRIGATIAGVAVQLAVYMGAKYIKTVGVSLHGNEYHDGSKHDRDDFKDKDWPGKAKWDWMVRVFNLTGIKVKPLRDEVDDSDECSIAIKEPLATQMLLDSDIRFPRRVVILGTGPHGRNAYNQIREDDFVIAVNGAVNIPYYSEFDPIVKFKVAVWVCADGDATKAKWFKAALDNSVDVLRFWSFAVSARSYVKPDYLFKLMPFFDKGFRQNPDKFRPDATVAGIAIDMAHRFGAREIILCGVDMSMGKYYDGTDAPGNVDDNHGEVWDMRDALDNEIRWMHSHGVRVSTMSITKLIEPFAYNSEGTPSVALMTLSFNPVFTKQAIFHAAIQEYPNHLKTLYLITQNGDQPRMSHDLPFRLFQFDVAGKWPELWLLKLMKFFEHATEDYVAIFDEDDYFEPTYIKKAIDALLDQGVKFVWNFDNKMVNRFKIVDGTYRSGFGTIVGERKLLHRCAKIVWFNFYGVKWYPGSRPPDGFDYNSRGCQDANYYVVLVKEASGITIGVNDGFEMGPNIGLHDGVRWYVEHLNANTCSGRKDEDCIDFNMPGLWYNDTRFEQTRYNNKNKVG